MRNARLRALFVAPWLLLVGGVQAARAQPGRGYIDVDGLYRPTTTTFADNVNITTFAEPGSVDTTYRVKAAPGFDVGAGVRVWRSLAIGASVSYQTLTPSGDVTALVPHPLFFNQPRTVLGAATGLSRTETAVNLHARWTLAPRGRWQVSLGGGPSVFLVRQSLVENVNLIETYPFDTAVLASTTSQAVRHNGVGFNAGVDVAYFFGAHVGIGSALSFARAVIDLPVPGGGTVKTDAGGADVGVGLRIRF